MFNKPYELKGKHATYIRFLNANSKKHNKEAAGIFEAAADIYMIAPLIGAAYNLRSPVDNDTQDSFSIFGDAIINRQASLETVYRLIMLSEKSVNLSPSERIERAFKDDEILENVNANMELFHQYMRGGIEWLYEHITEGAKTQDEYLEKINEIVKLYADDFEIDTSMEIDNAT